MCLPHCDFLERNLHGLSVRLIVLVLVPCQFSLRPLGVGPRELFSFYLGEDYGRQLGCGLVAVDVGVGVAGEARAVGARRSRRAAGRRSPVSAWPPVSRCVRVAASEPVCGASVWRDMNLCCVVELGVENQ